MNCGPDANLLYWFQIPSQVMSMRLHPLRSIFLSEVQAHDIKMRYPVTHWIKDGSLISLYLTHLILSIHQD